jgi:hypothetical protein
MSDRLAISEQAVNLVLPAFEQTLGKNDKASDDGDL